MSTSTPQPVDAVLMMRPASFAFNRETAASNAFQHDDRLAPAVLQARALAEFEGLRGALTAQGVEVVCAADEPEPPKPDAIFPNNWISLHGNGDVVLYPMATASRRAEVRPEVVELLAEQGFAWRRIHDLSDPTELGGVLEGTGSLVLDQRARLAYACLSPRTEERALRAFCERFDYEPIAFRASDESGRPVYHTNVLMMLGEDFAVLCLEAVGDARQRRSLTARLEATGHELLAISLAQMRGFAANLLELVNGSGERLLVASSAAHEALGDAARARLAERCRFLLAPLPTIERHGGGSARCMLAEIGLPRRGPP